MKFIRSHILLLFPIFFGLLLPSCQKDKPESSGLSFLELTFDTYVDAKVFEVEQNLYFDDKGRNYRVEMLKFYLSNWMLEKQDGTMFPIADVYLIDYSQNQGLVLRPELDKGTYVNLHFGVGLDSIKNATDPVSYAPKHPLSITQNTYWTWSSTYKFFMLEGRVDTLGGENPNQTFSYHSGFNNLYRNITIPLNDLYIGDEGASLNLQMDLAKVLSGHAGRVDFVEDPFSHSEDDIEMIQILSNNLTNAFTVNEF